MAVAMANSRVQGELRNAGEEGRQVAAHRQPCAEPGDDAARHGLRNADPAAWQAQFDVIRPQRGGGQPPNMPMIILPSMRVSGDPSRCISW